MLTKRKKNRCACLILALILTQSAVGCSFVSVNEKTDSSADETTPPDIEQNIPESFAAQALSGTESESSMQAYQSVLENQTMLYDTSAKQEMLLSDWLNSEGLSIQKYAVIDLNGDSDSEMVLWLDHGNYTDYGFEVLHSENNTVYAYGFPYRGFNDLKADGTYHWSGGAGHHGTAAIDFAGDTYTETNLAYCDNVTDPKTIHYYIGDRLVTKEEFDEYESQQSGKPDAVWVEYAAGN